MAKEGVELPDYVIEAIEEVLAEDEDYVIESEDLDASSASKALAVDDISFIILLISVCIKNSSISFDLTILNFNAGLPLIIKSPFSLKSIDLITTFLFFCTFLKTFKKRCVYFIFIFISWIP